MAQPPIERKIMVWKRDKWRCRYCGENLLGTGQATVDHVIPKSKGGSNRMANLVTACVPCNQAKADKLPGEIQSNPAMKAALVASGVIQ